MCVIGFTVVHRCCCLCYLTSSENPKRLKFRLVIALVSCSFLRLDFTVANLPTYFFFNNNLVHIDQSLITKLIGIVSSPVDGFSYDSNKAVRCLSCQHKSLIIRPDALAVMQMPVVAIYSCALYTG